MWGGERGWCSLEAAGRACLGRAMPGLAAWAQTCWSSVWLHPSEPLLRHPELNVRITQTVRPEPRCAGCEMSSGCPQAPPWCGHWCCLPSAWPWAGLVALQVAVLPHSSCQEHVCRLNSLLLPSGLGCSYLLLTRRVHGTQERRAGLQHGEMKVPWGITALSSHTAGSSRQG